MRRLEVTNAFRKDIKKARKQGKDTSKLDTLVTLPQENQPLPSRCRPHLLIGHYAGFWECHITPDWLLIYGYPDTETLELARLGSHSELFG